MTAHKTLKVIQITDTHLFQDEVCSLQGMNTFSTFSIALDKIKQDHSKIDLIIVTGDIAQDHNIYTYRKFIEVMCQNFDCPVHWIPGNHDSLPAMRNADTQNFENPLFDIGDWQFVMLNSGVYGKVHGNVDQQSIDNMNTFLEKNNKPTLVCFHHHPILMDSAWIDTQRIRNSEYLLEQIHKHEQVKIITWGHVHQESQKLINGIEYMSTPSTCFQFKPKQSQYQLDDRLPGFRWYELNNDGSFTTGVTRVSIENYQVDAKSTGY